MGRNNVPLIVLLILLLISGFIAFKFYSDAQMFLNENKDLKENKVQLEKNIASLNQEKESLQNQIETLDKRWKALKEKVSMLEDEKKLLTARYSEIKEEKEALEERLSKMPKISITEEGRASFPDNIPEHWEDVVKERAELEAKVDQMDADILEMQAKLVNVNKQNKELSVKIDELTKDKERLEEKLAFKERTIQVMSKDLVNERETRQAYFKEMSVLRDQNIELKQEIIVNNENQNRLHDRLKESISKRESMSRRVAEIEKVLKEKSLLFEQLKDELVNALRGDGRSGRQAVELPPIVVEPEVREIDRPVSKPAESSSIRHILRGSLLAVNERDGFVIIDLGAQSGVTPGTQFEVYRGRDIIGMVEVIETRGDISAADIKSSLGKGPFKEGDTVVSK